MCYYGLIILCFRLEINLMGLFGHLVRVIELSISLICYPKPF